jgi:hypothetical protein
MPHSFGMNDDPLRYLRNRLFAAEASLTKARADLETEAGRLGVPLAGLFAETKFVPRVTAEKWSARAWREGGESTTRAIIAALEAPHNPPRSPFAHLAHTDSTELAEAIVRASAKARGPKG